MKKLYLILPCILFISCTTQIVRWPDKSEEQQSRSLETINNKSIFKDFLWTTPPISSVEISNSFNFKNEQFYFEIKDDQLILKRENKEYIFDKIKSDRTIYPNIKYLEPTSKLITKWVPKTTTVTETVPVHKTRTVPVTTFNADGSTSTSYQTESYTDWETRFVTKTEWFWESHSELSYIVPQFDYYNITIDENVNFYIYNLNDKYYLQNASYILCTEMNQTFWGEKEVNLIFIDTNSNGIYFEPDDHILFNTWNPYDENSSYKEISYLMDNQWYYIDELNKELYLDFSLEDELVKISYLNEKYIGNENLGTLTVSGINNIDSKIYVNGKQYRIKDNMPFKIEYGQFNIKVTSKYKVDFFDSFIIDSENTDHKIQYNETAPAALLKIKNIFSKNYFINVSNDIYSKTYYKTNEINIPFGENTVKINVNGFTLKKTINVDKPEEIKIDFEKEIQKI